MLDEFLPPGRVAIRAVFDAEELAAEREPLLRLVRVVDAEARLQDVPVRLHAVHDVVEPAVRCRAIDRDALLAECARRDDVREELLAGLRVAREKPRLVVVHLCELPHVALRGVERRRVLREREVALHAVVHVEVALLGGVVGDLLAPQRALLLELLANLHLGAVRGLGRREFGEGGLDREDREVEVHHQAIDLLVDLLVRTPNLLFEIVDGFGKVDEQARVLLLVARFVCEHLHCRNAIQIHLLERNLGRIEEGLGIDGNRRTG